MPPPSPCLDAIMIPPHSWARAASLYLTPLNQEVVIARLEVGDAGVWMLFGGWHGAHSMTEGTSRTRVGDDECCWWGDWAGVPEWGTEFQTVGLKWVYSPLGLTTTVPGRRWGSHNNDTPRSSSNSRCVWWTDDMAFFARARSKYVGQGSEVGWSNDLETGLGSYASRGCRAWFPAVGSELQGHSVWARDLRALAECARALQPEEQARYRSICTVRCGDVRRSSMATTVEVSRNSLPLSMMGLECWRFVCVIVTMLVEFEPACNSLPAAAEPQPREALKTSPGDQSWQFLDLQMDFLFAVTV